MIQSLITISNERLHSSETCVDQPTRTILATKFSTNIMKEPGKISTNVLSTLKSDVNLTKFQQKVYSACKDIPRGKVMTYSSLAAKIGHPKACRAVGSALRKNPFAPEVPCHRVVSSDCSLGGFSGSKNETTLSKKVKLLREEGVKFDGSESFSLSMKVDASCVLL